MPINRSFCHRKTTLQSLIRESERYFCHVFMSMTNTLASSNSIFIIILFSHADICPSADAGHGRVAYVFRAGRCRDAQGTALNIPIPMPTACFCLSERVAVFWNDGAEERAACNRAESRPFARQILLFVVFLTTDCVVLFLWPGFFSLVFVHTKELIFSACCVLCPNSPSP